MCPSSTLILTGLPGLTLVAQNDIEEDMSILLHVNGLTNSDGLIQQRISF